MNLVSLAFAFMLLTFTQKFQVYAGKSSVQQETEDDSCENFLNESNNELKKATKKIVFLETKVNKLEDEFHLVVYGSLITRQESEEEEYEAILCDGKSATISCSRKKKIEIVQADYGRQDNSTCASVDIRTTDCTSSKTTKPKVIKICNCKRSCEVVAGRKIFGDPCEETFKYLKISYKCVE